MNEITITHTHADGTLIEGSRKGDGVWDVLKGLHDNWRYFPSLRQIGLGQSRDKAAQTWKIDRAAEALRNAGHEITVEIDDTARRSFAEAEAERNERAEERADRMAGYADNAAGRSAAAFAKVQQISDGIPFGQPILVGHHSEGRARADIRRMDTGMRKGIDESRKADYYEHRAANAETYRESRENTGTTLRRIAKLEAEERDLNRRLDGRLDYQDDGQGGHKLALIKPEGEYLERLQVMAADVAEQLTYWRGVIEASGAKVWARSDFTKGDYVRSRGYWFEVLRVSAKSVTVPDPMPLIGITTVMSREAAQAESDKRGFSRMYTNTVPYNEITARKTAAEMAELIAAAEAQAAS